MSSVDNTACHIDFGIGESRCPIPVPSKFIVEATCEAFDGTHTDKARQLVRDYLYALRADRCDDEIQRLVLAAEGFSGVEKECAAESLKDAPWKLAYIFPFEQEDERQEFYTRLHGLGDHFDFAALARLRVWPRGTPPPEPRFRDIADVVTVSSVAPISSSHAQAVLERKKTQKDQKLRKKKNVAAVNTPGTERPDDVKALLTTLVKGQAKVETLLTEILEHLKNPART